MLLKLINPCSGCVLEGDRQGYVPAHGEATRGVLIVGEAGGEHEAKEGMPLVGKAGSFFWSQMQRVGLSREGFMTHNVLSCQPKVPGYKDNFLAGAPYEVEAISRCAPLLDASIARARATALAHNKTFVILTLGKIAFKRIMDLSDRDAVMQEDYLHYPHWNERYQAWVIAADHPSYLMRGNTHLSRGLWYAARRAVQLADEGIVVDNPQYLLDPEPVVFQSWCKGYFAAFDANPTETFLSYDIETAYKKGKSEDKLDSTEEDLDDDRILRISFAYQVGDAVSIPFTEEYLPLIAELFAHKGQLVGWNSAGFDLPRVAAIVPVNGANLDAMLAWHVLNTVMPKGLGAVTPFYAPNSLMWKHLSDSQPAYYNAKDADMALRCWLGIRESLREVGLWPTFERHILKLNEVLAYMSAQGLNRDEIGRAKAEVELAAKIAAIELQIDAAVPIAARQLKVYKKTPKDITGLVETVGTVKVTKCPGCSALRVKTDHYKSIGKKKLTQPGAVENPCVGLKSVKVETVSSLLAKPLPFKLSKQSLLRYQAQFGHKAIKDPKDHNKIVFNVNALKKLRVNYPTDPLYPLIGEHRRFTKLISTYIGRTDPKTGLIKGGMPMGPDGKGHTTYTHNPSTLRLSCAFFHQLPRPDKKHPENPINWPRRIVVAGEGNTFTARDFSGIEAVLVGYEAKDPAYIRLAKMDVHSYYTAYAIYELEPHRILSSELPELHWSDEKLAECLAGIKARFGEDRNSLYKHLTHANNFGQMAKGAQEKILKETNVLYHVDKIDKVQRVYRSLFRTIPTWHDAVREEAFDKGYLRNAFDYVHHFNHVYKWMKPYGKWERKPGEDSEAVLAFRPQSNAAAIIKEAMLRLYFDHFDEVGQYLRLQVHDELFLEVPRDRREAVDKILQMEMERSIPQMPLPAAWNMGTHLSILTEPKHGDVWGTMK